MYRLIYEIASSAVGHTTKLIGGTTHVYYRRLHDLFAIDKATLKITKIELPLRMILAISLAAHDNEICVSVSNKRDFTDNTVNLNQVVLIKGNKIIRTLVSNNRKPALSPLDKPNTKITLLDHQKDKILLFSNHTLGYINPTKQALATYQISTKKWKNHPKTNMKTKLKHDLNHYVNYRLKNLTTYIDKTPFYLTSTPPYEKEPPLLQASSSKRFWSSLSIDRNQMALKDPDGTYIKKLEVNVPPVDSPLFNKKISSFRVSDYKEDGKSEIIVKGSYRWKGWWHSPNDQILKKRCSLHIVAIWKNHVIVTLGVNGRGLPAIWIIPISRVHEALRETLANNPAPISFDQQKSGTFSSLSYPNVDITTNDNHAQIWKNMGIQNSQGIKISGGDKKFLILTSKGLYKDGFATLSLYARRWRKEKPFQFRISMKVDGVWKEVHNADKTKLRIPFFEPNVEISFPEKARIIRLELSCHPKNAVLIDDLLLR